jgi:polyisoprenoid-binding protein YceI
MSTNAATPLAQPQPGARQWVIDPARSTIEFKVRHVWGLLAIAGHFDQFDGVYAIGSDGTKIDVTIDAGSIDTGIAKRDNHLRSADFFDATAHPHVRFTSTRVDDAGDGTLHVAGELEAAGKRVTLVLKATVREDGDELEIEATTTVDHRQLGMAAGQLGVVRTPSTLHVTARLT